jgi:UDP-N-acetylmuramoyl-tripeptide--D-alanyl-D-alanine ligase
LIDCALTLGVLYSLGLPLEPAIEILSNWSPIIGRGEVLSGEFYENCNITMVDESFNANPLSMTSCLEGFSMTYHDKNKVLIVGDMAEGGVNTVE